MTDTKRTLLLALSIWPLGCSSGSSLNIGNTGGTGGTVTPQLAQYAGSWDGHAEAYSFGPDGSDRVRLTLDASGNGTIQVGDGTLAPATDPNIGYPPALRATANGFSLDFDPKKIWEGYPYPMHSTRVEAGRLQFGVDSSDVFSGWCGLQTPVAYDIGSQTDGSASVAYNCVPAHPQGSSIGSAGGGDGGTECAWVGPDGSILATTDCARAYLCAWPVCSCTASGCMSIPSQLAGTFPAAYAINWDGALDATPATMTATLVVNGTRLTVHVTRQ